MREWGIRNGHGDTYEETLDEDDTQTAKQAGPSASRPSGCPRYRAKPHYKVQSDADTAVRLSPRCKTLNFFSPPRERTGESLTRDARELVSRSLAQRSQI